MNALLNRKFVTLWLVLLLSGIVGGPANALFPVYVEDELGHPPLFTAALQSLFLASMGLFAVVGGALSDGVGRKNTLLFGLAGSLLGGASFLLHAPWLLFLLFCCMGLASSLSTTAGQSYMMDCVEEKALGLATAAYFLSNTAGNSLGNFLIGPFIDRFGFRSFGAGAILWTAAVLVGACLFLPDLPRAEGSDEEPVGRVLLGYGRILRKRSIQLLIGLRYFPTFFWGIVTLLVPLLIFRAAGTVSSAAHYFGLSLLLASGCQILTGRACDRIGRKIPVLVACGGITISVFCLGLSVSSVVGLYVFGTLCAMFAWSLSTTMPGLIAQFSEPEERGRGVGITHLAWSFGMLSGKLVGGSLVEMNPSLPFYVATGACLVSCGLAIRLLWRQKV